MKSRTAAPSRRNSGLETTDTQRRAAHLRHHDLFAGSGIYGAAHCHYQRLVPAGERFGDLLGNATQLIESQVAVLLRGRAHADQRDIRIGQRVGQGDGSGQTSRVDAIADQLFQPGFEERRASGADGVHLELVAVHAHHAMANVRQAGGGDTSYIAEAQDGDLLGKYFTRKRIHAL